MTIFKNIDTPVLRTILEAHATYYRKMHPQKNLAKCKGVINRIESEIDLRQKCRAENTATHSYSSYSIDRLV